MTISRQLTPHSLFASDHECVTYLFRKRWPGGFVCPFCNTVQKEIAPAYTVVCRFCRKQTSITAQTVMHGSKNNILSWILVAWQFCYRDQGLSARQIQRLMALSSYQTAWTWLQKIRKGAALAESVPCRGVVAFAVIPLDFPAKPNSNGTTVGVAMEIKSKKGRADRIRIGLLESVAPETVSTLIGQLVAKKSALHLDTTTDTGDRLTCYFCRHLSHRHRMEAETIVNEASNWLSDIYRKGIETSYLQSYLDEFTFRYNTSSWPNRFMVFEHLIGGLLSCPSSSLSLKEKNVTELLAKSRARGAENEYVQK